MHRIFKEIPNTKGRYQISNFGEVKSFPRNGGRGGQGYILNNSKGSVSVDGKHYKHVNLSVDAKRSRQSIHRLVANAFLDNPENKPHVNHIDNNPENNCVSNLEWCTHSENMIHAQKQGRLAQAQHMGGTAAAKLSYARIHKHYEECLGTAFINLTPRVGKILPKLTFRCDTCLEMYTINHSKYTKPYKGVAMCKHCTNKQKKKI